MPVKIFGVLSSYMLLAQTVGPLPIDAGISVLSQVERMTLVGALIIAVMVLWRKVQSQDAQLVKFATDVSAALAASIDSNKELRAAISVLQEQIRDTRSHTVSGWHQSQP